MSTAMFVEQEPRPAPCYGVDVDGDGSLVVAKRAETLARLARRLI